MERVISKDGTSITFYNRGRGRPLVLVHGTGGTNPVMGWTAVLPTLEQHFTIFAIDRRGYGASGDNLPYSIEREFEDIAAVVDAIGEPVSLLGHSFGALCALEAALLTPNLHKLILYEPAVPLPDIELYPEGVLDRLQSLLDAGDREELLTVVYREIAMMSSHDFEQLRSSPTWPERLARAHAVPRESRAEDSYRFDARRFSELHTPTLLLLGGESPEVLKTATETIASALPNSQIAVMPRQQHIAMITAPELFASELIRFCLS